MRIIGIVAVLLSTQAFGADLTLNDLPDTLKAIRGCGTGGIFSLCKIPGRDVWASVQDGNITIFYENGGLKMWGDGSTVSEAVQSLATKLNRARADAKLSVDSMAPFLPTQ